MTAFNSRYDFPLSNRSSSDLRDDRRDHQFSPLIDAELYSGTRQVRDFSESSIRLDSFIVNIYHPFEQKPFFIKTIQIISIESKRTIDGTNELKIDFEGDLVKLQKYNQGANADREGDGQTIVSVSPMVAFPDGAIVQLLLNVSKVRHRPKFTQLNLCYVDSVSSRITPTSMGFSISLPGIEDKMQQNRFFVDQITKKETKSDSQYTDPSVTSSDLMVDYDKIAKKFSDLKPLLFGLWDNLIYKTNRVDSVGGKRFTFGGLPFIAKSGDDSDGAGFLRFEQQYSKGYTQGFLNILQLPSQLVGLGSTIDFWEMISSFATPPLYEVFCDPLQGESILGVEGQTYTVEKNSAKLIFRKTPFEDLFDANGDWQFTTRQHYLIAFGNLLSYNVSRSFKNVYSGIHVGLSSFIDYVNVVTVKPFFDNYLRAIYGMRLMQIKLPGMSGLTEKKETNKTSPTEIKGVLGKIQDRLAKIFINAKSMKHLTGTFTVPLTLFRVGTPFKLLDLPSPETTEKERKYIGNLPLAGYITTVVDKISIAEGTAETMVQFKWCPEPYNSEQKIDLGLMDVKNTTAVRVRDADLAEG